MTEPTPMETLVQARARSRNARDRFFATLNEVREKLNPKTLARDAVGNVAHNVMRDTVETVRAKPGTIATAAGLAMLFVARKPLARMLRRGTEDEPAAPPENVNSPELRKEGSDL